MDTIYKQISGYIPYNEQEEKDKQVMLKWLEEQSDAFLRDNKVAHFTSSAWILNPGRDKILMVYHNLFDSWSWTGGHADGDTDLKQVALREGMEETGVQQLKLLADEIFSLEIIVVDGHVKKGEYVPSHLHMNVTYLLEADEAEHLKIKTDENSGVKWMTFEEICENVTEPWMLEKVYKKLESKRAKLENCRKSETVRSFP